MRILFQCFGITGFIFIFYALLALAITQANKDPFLMTLLGLGALCLLVFLVDWIRAFSKDPSKVRDLFQRRSTKSGFGAIVYSIIAVLILVVANIQSQKMFYAQKDFTTNQVHTLSDQSVKLVKGLKKPLTITAFFDERNQQKQALKDLLQKYEAKSKNVKVVFVDPDQDRLLAEKFGSKDGDIVFESEGKNHTGVEVTEEGITKAILKVTKNETSTLCFTADHGELNPEGSEEDPRSASMLKGGLENEGYEVSVIRNLLAGVEDKCAVLVVAGPTSPFNAGESAAMDGFLQKGGKAVFLLDPIYPDPKRFSGKLAFLPTGLSKLLSKWGIGVGNNLILEKQLQLLRGVQIVPTIRVRTFGDHPIVEPFKGVNSRPVFNQARSMEPMENFGGTVISLFKSSPDGNSWGITNINAAIRERKIVFSEGDVSGPVSFGVVAEKEIGENKTAQIVAIGDSDFVSNQMIASYELNYDLMINAFNFLAGDQKQISIRPKKFQASAVELSPKQSNLIFYIVIVLIPMLVLTFGLNLWWYRRRKG